MPEMKGPSPRLASALITACKAVAVGTALPIARAAPPLSPKDLRDIRTLESHGYTFRQALQIVRRPRVKVRAPTLEELEQLEQLAKAHDHTARAAQP